MPHQASFILYMFICGLTTTAPALAARCDHDLCPQRCMCYFMRTNASYINIRLDCGSANITSIPTDWQIPFCRPDDSKATGNLSVLISINLSHNQITTVKPLATLVYLDYVNSLDVSHNSLTDLSDLPLQNMTSLRVLLVNDNKLTHIPESFNTCVPDTISTNRISLYNNPWSCDCKMNWLRGWLAQIQDQLIHQEKTQCDWPSNLKGQPLINLTTSHWLCDSAVPKDHSASRFLFVIVLAVVLYLLLCSAVALCFVFRKRHQVKPGESYVVYSTNEK